MKSQVKFFLGIARECLPYGGQAHMAANESFESPPELIIRGTIEEAWKDAVERAKKLPGTPVVFEVEPTESHAQGGWRAIEGGFFVPAFTLERVAKRA